MGPQAVRAGMEGGSWHAGSRDVPPKYSPTDQDFQETEVFQLASLFHFVSSITSRPCYFQPLSAGKAAPLFRGMPPRPGGGGRPDSACRQAWEEKTLTQMLLSN